MHKLLAMLVQDVVSHVFSNIYHLIVCPPGLSRNVFLHEVHRGGGMLWPIREIRRSHGGDYIMECGAKRSSRNLRTFQRNILLPFSE